MPAPVVLASASPVRRELLSELVDRFEVLPADIDEEAPGISDPRRLTLALARAKARAVASWRSDALVIGADTLAWCAGEVIGKPVDRVDGVRILHKLATSPHSVITGLWLVAPDGREVSDCVSTELRMRRLSDETIQRLVDLPGALDAAGAYRLQDDDPNVIGIEGSASNVKGLPLDELRELITELYPQTEPRR